MPIHTSFHPHGRKELKHRITYIDYMLLRHKLRHEIKLDPHAERNGRYLTHSCDFYNFENKVMNEKDE